MNLSEQFTVIYGKIARCESTARKIGHILDVWCGSRAFIGEGYRCV